MGFWSSVGNVAKGVADNMAETSEKGRILAEDFRRESDDYLKKKLKTGSMSEKMAAAAVLKERGYGNQG